MWINVKENVIAVIKTLMYGLFGILPAILFAGLIGGFLVLLGIDDKVNENFFYIYVGACGGDWLRKKLILKEIEKLQDDSTKWDIYSKLKNG